MEDCSTCKFEGPSFICIQGHARKVKSSEDSGFKAIFHESIENCHGWEEKRCVVCDNGKHDRPIRLNLIYQDAKENWTITGKDIKYCSMCGGKLNNIMS